MPTIKFSLANYHIARKYGLIEPPAVFAPFINISRRSELFLPDMESLEKLKSRLDKQTFNMVRGAFDFTQRYCQTYNPAFLNHYDEFINDEWLSMVDWHKPFHRDHIVHQPLTTYIGMSLMKRKRLKIKFLELAVKALKSHKCKYLWDYAERMGVKQKQIEMVKTSQKLLEDMFLDAFFLAAMFHDAGYPTQLLGNIHKNLKLYPGSHSSFFNTERIFKEFGNRLIFYPFNSYRPIDSTIPNSWLEELSDIVEKSLIGTHGLPGGILMLSQNDALRDFQDHSLPLRRFCIEWAAMAVMMHDLFKIYSGSEKEKAYEHLRINFDKDPLSFMLTLSDQIQDFERPNAEFSHETEKKKTNEEKTLIKYHPKCENVELEYSNDNVLTIKYHYRKSKDQMANIKYKKDAEKQYFHPSTGYLGYSSLNISRIKLQSCLIGH